MKKTSPELLLNSVSLRFPELLRTYQIHRKVFDRPLNFDAFYRTLSHGVQKPDHQFLEWFVGFSEGESCFYVGPSGRCSFSIAQRDEPLLQLIQQTLGFGSIYPDRRSPGVFQYRVESFKKDVFPLIQLFNGNLLLKKTNERFKLWVANYNRRCGTELHVVSRWDDTFKPVIKIFQEDPVALQNTSVVWNSSWFSGFVDGEGCFSVDLGKPDVERLKFRGIPRFQIAQKAEAELMLNIAFLIGRGCFSRKINGIPGTTQENGIYQFEARSRISLKRIQEYLKKHPLRGKKALSYSKWCQAIVELEKCKVLLDLASSKGLLRRYKVSRALNRGCESITSRDRGATSFLYEEHEKLVALVKNINPVGFSKKDRKVQV